jgi:hypothetical protein
VPLAADSPGHAAAVIDWARRLRTNVRVGTPGSMPATPRHHDGRAAVSCADARTALQRRSRSVAQPISSRSFFARTGAHRSLCGALPAYSGLCFDPRLAGAGICIDQYSIAQTSDTRRGETQSELGTRRTIALLLERRHILRAGDVWTFEHVSIFTAGGSARSRCCSRTALGAINRCGAWSRLRSSSAIA